MVVDPISQPIGAEVGCLRWLHRRIASSLSSRRLSVRSAPSIILGVGPYQSPFNGPLESVDNSIDLSVRLAAAGG